MKYVAVAIIVIIIGVMVGASVRANNSKSNLEPESPPVPIEVKENPESPPGGSTPVKSKKTMEKEGVTIDVLKEGNGPAIKSGQKASVHYSGALTDGKIFDASKNHGGPFEFQLGSGMVIRGWEVGVEGMKVGEIRKLTIPPNQGYGAGGIPGTIPPNATLVFEVELVGIK